MATKLCFVINSLEGGGAERVISNLANHFSNKDCSVTMICLNTAQVKYHINEQVKIVNLLDRKDNQNFLNRIRYGFLTFYRLLVLLKKEKPNCTICFMTSANIWAGLSCMILGLPYLVSERTALNTTLDQYNKLLQWFVFHIYRKSKAIVLPAFGMFSGFKRIKQFEKLHNFKTIYNPIHQFVKPNLNAVNNKPFILSVGRLSHEKGFDLLIDAYQRLALSDVDLLISGEGQERENLEKQIAELNLTDKVKLIGFKSNLQDYYAQADVFVLSSRNEGYPNVLVEAMGMGCACVAMDCEFGPSEIIDHGVNGFLIKNNDIQSLSDAIGKLLSNSKLRDRFSAKAKLINETNSIEKISANWEELILS
ncbi:glycosyltransferase family 4 protein [Pedobacter sp. GSP4]|uniref:glycosyltransferase family 4 protein n=1 Tax=Pedobacter sp. GSP4 TaxID=3453716 RepID=UPI003EEC63A6